MKTKILTLALAATLSLGTASAFADHTETILGAAIGGATGAAIGHNMGGRGDVILWSALGGAAGAAIGRSLAEPHEREVVVQQRIRYDDEDRYVVVQPPPRVRYVYEAPVRYYPAPYYPAPYYRVERWHDHGHHHRWHHRDWDDD